FSLPVSVATATSVVSARPMISVLPATCAPRLTVSQHITGMTDGSCFGEYFQMTFGPVGSEMSMAKTLFGNAEGTDIRAATPVENCHATLRSWTFDVLIWSSLEYLQPR